MKRNEKYQKFLDEIGWDEFNPIERQYFFDDIGRKPQDGSGILFTISHNKLKKNHIVITHLSTKAKLEITKKELSYFIKWVENQYAFGEDGSSYFSMQSNHKKEDLPKIEYASDIEQKVLSMLQEFCSQRRIGREVTFASNKGSYIADFVIYDINDDIRVIIEAKSATFISETTFHKLSEYLQSVKGDVIFVLTDGNKAIYSKNGEKCIESSLKQFLTELFPPTEKQVTVSFSAIKLFLKNAVSNTKANGKTEQDKARKLKRFVNELHASDIIHDRKDKSIWFLSTEKERELFGILLGEYNKDYIVKFSSVRSLLILLEKETYGMCSLVCMNDPSEKDYADTTIGIPQKIDNSMDTFIISACNENAERNLTMWRLYGDDAKGVCLKFWIDKDKLNQHGFYLAPVSYAKSNGEHYELEIIRGVLMQAREQNWKFELSEWQVWKHFFKQNTYAVEEEIRLIYMPSEYVPLARSIWFTDDRTSIYSEMKVFDLSHDSSFPLTLNKVILGIKFPSLKENVPQINRRLSKSNICIHKNEGEELVSHCDIENYR